MLFVKNWLLKTKLTRKSAMISNTKGAYILSAGYLKTGSILNTLQIKIREN